VWTGETHFIELYFESVKYCSQYNNVGLSNNVDLLIPFISILQQFGEGYN